MHKLLETIHEKYKKLIPKQTFFASPFTNYDVHFVLLYLRKLFYGFVSNS